MSVLNSYNEIIFSKHFPRPNYSDLLSNQSVNPENKRREASDSQLQCLFDIEHHAISYKTRPNANRIAETFVDLAKRLSEDYQIDTEIVRSDGSIYITMILECGPYHGFLKRDLLRILWIADEWDLIPDKQMPYGVKIILCYNFVIRYYNGRQIP